MSPSSAGRGASRVPRTALLLISALAMVVALSAALLALTLTTLDRFEAAEREVAHLDRAKHAAHIVEAQIREQQIQQVRAMIEDSLENLARYGEAARTTRGAIARLERLVRLPDERRRTAEMAQLSDTIHRRFVDRVVPAIRAGRRAEVVALHRQVEPLVRRDTASTPG
jgi:CHASE3 domain sensor protein